MKLIVFDVDGTLVDSQGDILGAMTRAFDAVGLEPPSRAQVLSIVGLSLPVAMAELAKTANAAQIDALVEGYKAAYTELRAAKDVSLSSPLYPGVRDVLDALSKRDDLLLGVATGKSRKGLDKLLDGHELRGVFVTEQVADHHPSKPHPAMLQEAMAECGVTSVDTVMVGDTSFDMDMAASAGCIGIGVSWGYHPRAALSSARMILEEMADLPDALTTIWGSKI